jgi:hypothetical protein
MKWLPALGCCLFLWACNARHCGKDKPQVSGADTLTLAEQWQGTVHAVTCQNIEVRLSFAHKEGSDTGTFQLMQRCKDNNNTFNDEGVWILRRGKDTIYTLVKANGEGPSYYKVKGNRLYELDADKKEVTTYYLKKVE